MIAACLQKERKKRWDEKNQEAIAEAVKQLDEFDKVDNTWVLVFINCLMCKHFDLQSKNVNWDSFFCLTFPVIFLSTLSSLPLLDVNYVFSVYAFSFLVAPCTCDLDFGRFDFYLPAWNCWMLGCSMKLF